MFDNNGVAVYVCVCVWSITDTRSKERLATVQLNCGSCMRINANRTLLAHCLSHSMATQNAILSLPDASNSIFVYHRTTWSTWASFSNLKSKIYIRMREWEGESEKAKERERKSKREKKVPFVNNPETPFSSVKICLVWISFYCTNILCAFVNVIRQYPVDLHKSKYECSITVC